MKVPTPSTRQMVEFLAISFIAAIYLAPAVRAAPSPRSVRPFPTGATARTISHHPPRAHETPQDVQPVPSYTKQQEQQMWGVRQAQERTSTSATATASVSVSVSVSVSASSDLGPSPTITSTTLLKKRYIYYTKEVPDEQKEGKKGKTSWPIKDSVDKISSWLRGQKNKLLSQVDKIRGKGKTRYGENYREMNPLPFRNIIGSGRGDDDYEEKELPLPVKMETAFQHPENATQAERFRNALLLEAPSQVKPGVKVNVDFSTVRSTINGVNGAEYYGYGNGKGYGFGYGYSYGLVAAGVFAITLLWMLVRRRPGMFGSGFPCSRPGWVGSLVGRWKGRRGVGGLEGGQVEEIRRGRALLRED